MATPHKLARDTACSFLTIALNSTLGLVVTALAARWLQPERMGLYTFLVWAASIATMGANLGTVTATMKYMAEALGREDAREAAGILACTARQVAAVGLLIAASMALLGPPLAVRLGHAELVGAVRFAAFGLLPTALVALWTSACQARRRYDQVAVATALTVATSLALTVPALLAGWGITGLIAASSLGMTVGAVAYATMLERWYPRWWAQGLGADQRRMLASYQGPVFIMLALDAVVWQRSEVFFLGAYSPQQEVAFYGMAFSLATMAMRLIPGTLIGLLLPNMSRAMGGGDEAQVARIFQLSCRTMAMLALPVAVGGSLLAPALVGVLYGPGYEPVAGLLGMMLAANALVMIFGFPASSVLYATDEQGRLVRIGLVVSAFNLALAWWWIPAWGAWGAVAACSLAQAASLVPGMRVARRRLGVGAPWRAIARIALATALMAVPVLAITHWLSGIWALGGAIAVAVPTYLAALWAGGALEASDRAALAALVRRRAASLADGGAT